MEDIVNGEVAAVLKARYGEMPGHMTDTISTLSARVDEESKRLGRPILTRIPSIFVQNDSDQFDPIPQYIYPRWDTLAAHLESFGITGGALFIFQTTWQLHFPFRDVVQAAGLFTTIGNPHNLPLCVEMIKQTPVRCVVLHQDHFHALKNEVEAKGLVGQVELVVVMRGVSEPAPPTPLVFPGAVTIQEIHAFPGHVILTQSLALAGTNDFHPHDMYYLERGPESCYISGLREDALPVWRYRLPITCREAEAITSRPTFTVTSCQIT